MFIMIGVPGVGKSTFTSLLTKALPDRTFLVGSTDDLIDQYAAEHGETYSEAFKHLNFKQLNRQMNDNIAAGIAAGVDVLVDRTNMSKKSRKPFLAMAPNYEKIALNFTVDDRVLVERLRHRAETTGKSIPDFVVRSMFRSYECPSRDEGFSQVVEIDNT